MILTFATKRKHVVLCVLFISPDIIGMYDVKDYLKGLE